MIRKVVLSFLCFTLCAFISIAGHLQDIGSVVNTFRTSMYSRDAEEMSEFIDNTIELTYGNTHSTYSRDHALVILSNFYSKNLPTSFNIDYTGISANKDAHYVIGTAVTQNGKFKVFLYIKNKGGKFVIQEMKIDK